MAHQRVVTHHNRNKNDINGRKIWNNEDERHKNTPIYKLQFPLKIQILKAFHVFHLDFQS